MYQTGLADFDKAKFTAGSDMYQRLSMDVSTREQRGGDKPSIIYRLAIFLCRTIVHGSIIAVDGTSTWKGRSYYSHLLRCGRFPVHSEHDSEIENAAPNHSPSSPSSR